MKKYLAELSKDQKIVKQYIDENVTNDGMNFLEVFNKLKDSSERIPARIFQSYERLTSKEVLELIYFKSKSILIKIK